MTYRTVRPAVSTFRCATDERFLMILSDLEVHSRAASSADLADSWVNISQGNV